MTDFDHAETAEASDELRAAARDAGMSMAEKSRATSAAKPARGVLDGSKAVEARLAEGRAQRDAVPLEAHAEWTAPDDRPDPVGVPEEQNRTRVPELVPIRHRRMIVSPFTFYRGSAASPPPGCNGATSTSASCAT